MGLRAPNQEPIVTPDPAPQVNEKTADPTLTTDANFNQKPKVASEAGSEHPPEPEPIVDPDAPVDPLAGTNETPVDPVIPEYTPNFKFNVMDQQHLIDESFGALMKDEASEKMVRTLHEKALGLDHVKPKFNDLRDQHRELNTNHNSLMGEINDLRESVGRKDFDKFFESLAIPQEDVFNYVVGKARERELPAEQRAAFENQRNAERHSYELEKQTQQIQHNAEAEAVQHREYTLNIAMNGPGIQSAAQEFDSRPGGRPGAFQQEVINRGKFAWNNYGKDLSPEQAIQEVLQFSGIAAQNPGPPQYQQQQPPLQGNVAGQNYQGSQPPQPARVRQRPPTIPNLAGKTGSPVQSRYKTLDDVKKYAKDTYGI